jgi:chromosome segregation ATPase
MGKRVGVSIFFPTVPAADETGERRGACLVARQEASTFATLPDWREASSHDWQAARSQGKANLPEGEHNAGCKTTEKEDSKTELFVHLNVERQTIEANWQAKDETIARLSAEIGAIDADRRAKDEVIARVNRELEAVDADRKAKDEVITRLSRELEAVNADRRAKDEVIAALDKELAAVEARSVLSHMAIKVRRRWTER